MCLHRKFPSIALSRALPNPKFLDFSSSKFTSVYFSHRNGQTKKWIFTKLKYTKLQNKRQLFVKKQSQNSVSKYLFGAFCFCDFNSPFFRYKIVCVSCEFLGWGHWAWVWGHWLENILRTRNTVSSCINLSLVL